MILLKTATETQKHNQQTSKKQFRSFPYDFTKNSNINQKTATETHKHNQHTFKKQFRSFPYDCTKNSNRHTKT